jgi:hypothetical protein
VRSWTAADKRRTPKLAEASNEATDFYVVVVQ